MNFSVEFYETVAGRCPVREFLDELKASDPGDFATILAALAKLQNRRYHAEPLSKALGNGLFELRHVGKLNTRVLYHPTRGPRLVLYGGTPHHCGSCDTQQGTTHPGSRLTDSARANG